MAINIVSLYEVSSIFCNLFDFSLKRVDFLKKGLREKFRYAKKGRETA